jgi:hypothetical protein
MIIRLSAIATDNGERERTWTDGLPQATRPATLTGRIGIWFRDEGTR